MDEKRIPINVPISSEKPEIPKNWDPVESAKKVSGGVVTIRNVAVEVLREVWIAYKVFSELGRRSGRLSVTVSHTKEMSFEAWCKLAGIRRRTAYRWLKRYDPVDQTKLPSPETKKARKNQPEDSPDHGHGGGESTTTEDSKSAEGSPPSEATARPDVKPTEPKPRPPEETTPERAEDPDERAERYREIVLDQMRQYVHSFSTKDKRRKAAREILNAAADLFGELNDKSRADDKAERSELRVLIKNAFEDVLHLNGESTDHWKWAVQMKAINGLIDRAMGFDDPRAHTGRVMKRYAELVFKSGEKFWSNQPFTPQRLNSEGIYTQVVHELDQQVVEDTETVNLLRELFGDES